MITGEPSIAMLPEKYLKSHLELLEKSLIAQSAIATSSGHSIHKGALREKFVKEFLIGHIGEDLGVSSGEIFVCDRVVGDSANQIDVIVYSRNLPKIRIVSEDINAFLCESVHATIEVKSTLDEAKLDATYTVASKIFNLNNELAKSRNWRIWNYLVAFDCVASLPTVANWMSRSAAKIDAAYNKYELCAVFVLGKGLVVSPDVALYIQDRTTNLIEPLAQNGDWLVVEQDAGNLHALFFLLNFLRYGIDIRSYFRDVLPIYTIVKAKRNYE